jgi:hypothetical protein
MVVYYSQVPGVVLPSGVFVPMNPLAIPSGWQWIMTQDAVTVCSAVEASEARAAEVTRTRVSIDGTEYTLPYTTPLALGKKVRLWTDIKNIGSVVLKPGIMWYIICIDNTGTAWMTTYDPVSGDDSYIQVNGSSLASVDVYHNTKRDVDPNISLTNIKSPTFTVSRAGTYQASVLVYNRE